MVELVESNTYFPDASSTTNKAITFSYLVKKCFSKNLIGGGKTNHILSLLRDEVKEETSYHGVP